MGDTLLKSIGRHRPGLGGSGGNGLQNRKDDDCQVLEFISKYGA
jgi:hypothetical protein